MSPNEYWINNVLYVTDLRESDVLSGRGSGSNDHEGNIRFRQYVAERKADYVATNHRRTKVGIAQQIVQRVYDTSGRFLRKIEDDDELMKIGLPVAPATTIYYEVITDEPTIMEKTKQALRQNAVNIRASIEQEWTAANQNRLAEVQGDAQNPDDIPSSSSNSPGKALPSSPKPPKVAPSKLVTGKTGPSLRNTALNLLHEYYDADSNRTLRHEYANKNDYEPLPLSFPPSKKGFDTTSEPDKSITSIMEPLPMLSCSSLQSMELNQQNSMNRFSMDETPTRPMGLSSRSLFQQQQQYPSRRSLFTVTETAQPKSNHHNTAYVRYYHKNVASVTTTTATKQQHQTSTNDWMTDGNLQQQRRNNHRNDSMMVMKTRSQRQLFYQKQKMIEHRQDDYDEDYLDDNEKHSPTKRRNNNISNRYLSLKDDGSRDSNNHSPTVHVVSPPNHHRTLHETDKLMNELMDSFSVMVSMNDVYTGNSSTRRFSSKSISFPSPPSVTNNSNGECVENMSSTSSSCFRPRKVTDTTTGGTRSTIGSSSDLTMGMSLTDFMVVGDAGDSTLSILITGSLMDDATDDNTFGSDPFFEKDTASSTALRRVCSGGY